MLAQRHCFSTLLAGVLITVMSLAATAADVATVADASQGGMQPSCSSNPGLDNGRRCLRLTALPPPPMPMAPSKPAAAYAPVAPAAAPARSWLGAVGKRIVSELVGLAEAPYSEGADWRAVMGAEIQAKLGQQPAPKRLASGS